MDKEEKREIQLVAREGVFHEILSTYPFATDNHRKVLQLAYDELLQEMCDIGLQPIDVMKIAFERDSE